MELTTTIALAGLILAAALVYSSVEYNGASAYLAQMALFGVARKVMKPPALAFNIPVAIIKFYRAGGLGVPF